MRALARSLARMRATHSVKPTSPAQSMSDWMLPRGFPWPAASETASSSSSEGSSKGRGSPSSPSAAFSIPIPPASCAEKPAMNLPQSFSFSRSASARCTRPSRCAVWPRARSTASVSLSRNTSRLAATVPSPDASALQKFLMMPAARLRPTTSCDVTRYSCPPPPP